MVPQTIVSEAKVVPRVSIKKTLLLSVSIKKTLLLNSRRLTATVMGRMAKELGLSISASLEDMRQTVSKKIEELGHELKNV